MAHACSWSGVDATGWPGRGSSPLQRPGEARARPALPGPDEEIEMSRTTARTRRPAAYAAALLATTAIASGVVTAALAGSATAAEGSAPATTAVDPNDPRSALLRADQMPAVNEVQDWTKVGTRSTRASN